MAETIESSIAYFTLMCEFLQSGFFDAIENGLNGKIFSYQFHTDGALPQIESFDVIWNGLNERIFFHIFHTEWIIFSRVNYLMWLQLV